VAKGLIAPAEVIQMFEHRKEVERGIISSHGEASRFFVTFLDNHDQHQRFFFSAPDAPARFEDQLTLGVGCLFALQGIPCLYYGTEQGLHGSGDQDAAVREALWASLTPSILSSESTGQCNDLPAFVVINRHCATDGSTSARSLVMASTLASRVSQRACWHSRVS
jgi:glycosidase